MKRFLPILLPVALFGSVALVTALQSADEVKPEFTAKVEAALPKAAPAKPAKDRKVLVFSKTNGFRHSSIGVGAFALARLGESTGAFQTVHTEDEGMFEPASLAEFDAVVFLNTTGDVFKPKEMPGDEAAKAEVLKREERLKQSLLEFVRGGRGLAGIHSATDTYHGWKEFNDMMGGTFAGHPWHELVPVKNFDPSHPVNKAFGGKDFEITDEIYQFRKDTASPADRRMLLGLKPEWDGLSKGNRPNKDYPISWVSNYGDGRTFYSSLGHREEIYWNAVMLEHFLAGIQFALGDLEADATPIPLR